MTWDFFFLFQRRDIKLQIGTTVNVLGIAEVLKKLSNTLQKVNHETTPPYLRDQFTTCDHLLKKSVLLISFVPRFFSVTLDCQCDFQRHSFIVTTQRFYRQLLALS